MKSLVIFDLDGTLLDTIADLGTATNYAMEQMGFPTHSLHDYRFKVGNGITKLIERALPDNHRDEATIERAREIFLGFYGTHNTDHSRPYPGIPELLSELTARGVKVAVASNKYHEATSRLVAHFFHDIPWTAVEGHRPGRPTKPSPQIVDDILRIAGITPGQTLYVGDSGVDMDTARAASLESVGVIWGFRPESELRDHLADRIATTPADILRYI
ncbi:MAG: HAD family hydrolase [Bacteroidales bacterium]|nr:HAD family hydrolase [Bacteroidales bacterium]